jgi:hypothetical protein
VGDDAEVADMVEAHGPGCVFGGGRRAVESPER